ncbi:hypothetical protein PLEOSDRAFT_159543 [Pleurotus ostreatus PC15]|uniref:Uncharacterized protein n=1 Tax=Pleurotus ostreatus (strain PC15) TaxID=1137138 RepID=A0A067NHT5_PLEO1|nr:hypothetical protein PLEOSDRAFT_159543 [Pleurotus ostreatus PC15]
MSAHDPMSETASASASERAIHEVGHVDAESTITITVSTYPHTHETNNEPLPRIPQPTLESLNQPNQPTNHARKFYVTHLSIAAGSRATAFHSAMVSLRPASKTLASRYPMRNGNKRRFSVVSSDSGAAPDSNAPTVTISGAPNPSQAFATTYAAVPNGAPHDIGVPLLGMAALLFGGIFGVLCTL